MDELRQELLQNQQHVVEFAKWKMILVGAVAVTGLGWTGTAPSPESGVLVLYCGGYLAAYADVFIFGRLLSIAVLGRFMRTHAVSGSDPQLLHQWELFVQSTRDAGVRGISERWAHFASSCVVAIGFPLLAIDRYKVHADARLLIPIAGVAAVIFVFTKSATARRRLLKDGPLLALGQAGSAASRATVGAPVR